MVSFIKTTGTLLIVWLIAIPLKGQLEFGLKAGVHSTDINKLESIDILNNLEKLKISVHETHLGYQLGVYSRIKIASFYLEPALLAQSSRVDYKVQEIQDAGVIEVIRTERFGYVDIPLIAGLKFGFFRIHAGPVGHIFIASNSDLFKYEYYKQNFKNITLGLQSGIGIDVWKFRLDMQYEGNLSAFGDHIVFDGKPYAFSSQPSRLLLTLGYKF
jgi:hypothetical protein